MRNFTTQAVASMKRPRPGKSIGILIGIWLAAPFIFQDALAQITSFKTKDGNPVIETENKDLNFITQQDLAFKTGSTIPTQRMVIKSNGSVGIGTDNPDKGILHIKGSFHVENDANEQLFHISKSKNLVFVGKDAWTHFNALQADQTLVDEANYSMWVSEGIVSEDFIIRSVESWSWPDFVFAEDYKLRSLKELKEYITENKHLPGMISQSKIEEQKGYSVIELDKNLLQKIEELTLYTIQQEEKLETQHAQIETLTKQLEVLIKKLARIELCSEK